jgi:hypothetical protein
VPNTVRDITWTPRDHSGRLCPGEGACRAKGLLGGMPGDTVRTAGPRRITTLDPRGEDWLWLPASLRRRPKQYNREEEETRGFFPKRDSLGRISSGMHGYQLCWIYVERAGLRLPGSAVYTAYIALSSCVYIDATDVNRESIIVIKKLNKNEAV